MKSSIKILSTAAVISLFCLCGCSKWTQPEHLDFRHKTAEELDPAAWEDYLASLRKFKQGEHKLTILTMRGTSEYPSRQPQHIMAMPDSADVICVDGCENLHSAIAGEISEVESKKGTKVISNVDLAVAYADWLDYKIEQMDEGRDESDVDSDAPGFFTRHAEKQLAWCDQYGFRGIMLSLYVPAGLNATERESCLNPFAEAAGKWIQAHPSHYFAIRGNFQNVNDKTILDRSDCLIIVLGGQKGVAAYKSELRNKFRGLDGKLKSRVVFEEIVPSSEEPKPKIDFPYVIAENILTKDTWKGYEDYELIGISVSNAHDDYYNENWYDKNDLEYGHPVYFGNYANVRLAIACLNK